MFVKNIPLKFTSTDRRMGVFVMLAVVGLLAEHTAYAGGWANITSSANPSSVYLGDTPTMGAIWVDTTENGNARGQVAVVARNGSQNLSSGTSEGAIITGNASQSITTQTAPQATATGSWYWGLRVQYTYGGGNYNAYQWTTGWVKMSFAGFPNDTTSVTLNYSVSALNAPSGASATRNSGNPQSAIDLAWTRGTSGSAKDTLVVRSTSSNFTAPTQGSTYNSGNTLGSGTVIYRGSATSLADSGLTPGTTYYYAFYAENYSYYSASATANTATRPTDATWDGGGSDDNWQTEANWAGDLYPVTNSILRFAGSTRLTPQNNYTAGSQFNQIWFNSGAGAFKLGGNALVVTGKIENSGSTGQVISNNITAGAVAIEINPVSGDLTMAGTINNNSQNITVYGNNVSATALNLTNTVSGSGKLIVKQKAQVKVSGTGSFTGNTEIDNGEVWVAQNGSLAGTIYVGNGGQLADYAYLYISDTDGGTTVDRPVQVNNGNSSSLRVVGGNNTSGANIFGGTMTFNGPTRLEAATGGTVIFTNTISSSSILDKYGNGTVILTNNANAFSSILTVYVGTVQASMTGSLGTIQSSVPGVVVKSGGTLAFAGSLTYPAETIELNGLGYTNGGALAKATSGGATFPGLINLGSDARIQVGVGSLDVNNVINLSNNTLYIRSPNTFSMAAQYITNATKNSGDGAIYKDGAGAALIRLNVDSTGLIVVADGDLRLGAFANVPTANTLPAGSHILMLSGGSLSANSAAKTLLKNVVVTGNVGFAMNGQTLTLAGGVSLGGADRIITNALTLNITGVITNGGYIKAGSGVLTLSSNNTYAGQTLVTAGDLIHPGTNTLSLFGVGPSGYLYGNGSLGGLTVTGQFSAGSASNTIGSLRVTNLVFASNGRMQLNMSNMLGTPGTDWDVVTVGGGSGPFTVNAVDGSDFIVAIKGNPSNFDINTGRTNILVDAGSASGFDPAKFTVDTTEFTPSPGVIGFTISTNTSGDLIMVFAPATSPNVVVLGNATAIANGSTSPQYTDHTDFTDVLVAGGTLTRTYTITNSGTATLGIGNVTTNAGGNPADFIVTSQPSSLSLAPGDVVTFQVQFNPSDAGVRYADVQFTNNVGAKNPYVFRVQGTGTYVEVAVTMSGNNIADGDATPSTTDGTDFGGVGLVGATSNMTYTITNSGNRAMTIGNVTTSGTEAADFIVTSQPTSPLNPSNTTSFTVQFNPSGVGLRSAALSFSTTDDSFGDGLSENPFNFSIQGTGVGPSITNSPTSLSFSSVLGSAPAAQTFGITNNGLGSMTYTVATNYSWLSALPNGATLAAGAGQVHTAAVVVLAGQQAGTSNGTITITSSDATNSPKTIAVTWTISAIPDPSAQSATADGKEMVDLAWTKNASYDVMIVYDTAAISTEPSQGTSYSVGGTIGTGKVIYKGSGASLEHVVPAGSAAHYKFYSYSGNYYSAGVSANVTLGSYRAGEIAETFSYTNTGTLATSGHGNGGSGWTNSWKGDTSSFNLSSGSFANQSSYPNAAGNKIRINSADIDGTSKTNVRQFAAITTGKVYVAWVMNYQYNGPNKYAGLSFMSGSTEEMYFGEVYGDDQKLGVGSTISSSNLLAGGGNDYIIIGMYDFAADTAYVASYKIGSSTVPTTEPTTWHATASDGSISSIDGIRLAAGAGGGSGTPGDTYFDEIRVAQSWSALLNLTEPVATNYVINGGSDVTDGQVTGGTYSVVFDFYDSAGLTNSASLPQFDIWNSSGTRILTNKAFSSLSYNGSGASLKASNATHSIASGSAVVLGVYTSRWTAANSNGVQVSNSDSLSNGTKTVFTVVDNDAAAPVFTGMKVGTGSGLTDGQLAAGGWTFTGLVQDVGSGIDADGTPGADPYPPHYDILNPSAVETVNNGLFDTTPSDGGGLAIAATLTESSMATISAANIVLGTWTARVFAADNDNDRTGDRLGATSDTPFTVSDDDTTGPVHSGFTGLGRTLAGATYTNVELSAGLVVTGLVTDAQSGVYAGTSNRWVLYRGGVTVNNGSFSAAFADGTCISSNGQLTATLASGDVSTSGSYTLRVFSVNYDIDRSGDAESTTTDYEFAVVAATEDVDLYGNSVLIPDGDTTPAYTDHTDFGDVLVAGSTVTRTFTITNSGANVIGIGNVTTNAGGNPTNFVVTAQPASSLAIGATTTFQVTFDPSAGGEMFANLQFTNTVPGAKNPYTFRVQGTGTYVEVAVTMSGNNIADGDATPSTTDGTDFGGVGLVGATSNMTYTITNSGNRAMTIGNVTTSGTEAADFIVTSQPTSPLNPSNTTSFTVQFNPSGVGLRSAALSFSTTDDSFGDGLDENPFNFSIQGTGVGPSITNSPTSLSFSSVLGSAPAVQTFGITNNGLGSMTYTVATNYSWLSALPNGATLAAGAGQVHTAAVVVLAGQQAGTSNGTITITSSDATNSPKTIAVTWTISAIPDPSAQTATASGAEHVALRWTKNASYNVMIVHRAGAASTAPSQGTSYSVGGSLGSGTVIYKGSGAYLDHVVAAGTTNYYAYYSYNGDYYSAGVTAVGTTTVYQAGEIVEPFSYTNTVGISGLNGGQGWTNAWTYTAGSINVVTDRFTSISGYPSLAGNAITSSAPEIYRGFAPVTAGKLYVAFMMRTENGGGSQYSGMSFFDGGVEEKFIGEGFSQVNALTVGGTSGRQLANNTDYTIIAMYDFDNDVAKALLYTNATESVPSTEPVSWHVQESDATVSSINRIRLAGNVGIRWDEIRVATSWQDLLSLAATYEWDAGAGVGDRAWNNVTNWTRNTEPTALKSAYINGGYTAVVSSAGAVATNLYVGTTNAPSTGGNPTGTLEQIGGTLTLDGDLVLGDALGSRGTYLMTNGTLTISYEDIFVGAEGMGLMTLTGTATVAMSGGTDDNLLIGFGSASGAESAGSTLNVGGSAVLGAAYDLRIAQEAGSDGSLYLAGGTVMVTNNILVGIGSSTLGRITMAGGTLDTYSHMRIGDLAGSTGIVTMTGGLLNLQNANLLIGNDGLGVMSVSGTATVDVNDVDTPSAIEGNIVIGDDSKLTNTLMVSGSAVINIDDDLYLGDDVAGANAILQQSGGSIFADNAYIGDNAGSTGLVSISGGKLALGLALTVGNGGIGLFNLSGGVVTAGTLRVSDLSGGTGTVTVSGGTLSITNTGASSMVMEQNGGLYQQNAGAVDIAGGIQLGDVAGARATVLLTGGSFLVGRNNASTEDAQLGNTSGSTGVVQMTGGFFDLNRSGIDLRLGDAGASVGIFTQGGGTTTVGNVIYVGSAAGSYGSVVMTNGELTSVSDLLLASGAGATGRMVQLGGRVAAGGNIEITTSTGNESYYEIQGGTLTNGGNLSVGRTDGLGTGVFHVVGGGSIIHVGDSTTEDLRIQNSGELRLSFSNSTITAIQVSDDINLSAGSTLTVSNYGAIVDGGYLVATSRNASAVVGTFSATNWVGGFTGTVSYANNRIYITFTTPSEIAVVGTNYAVISSGDLVPDTADGTDFGPVATVGATLDRTLFITNSGGGNLTISGVTTSGTDAARFSVISWPTVVAPGTASNLTIRFDPTVTGLATALITIANNDSDEGTYTFVIQGTGVAPSITNSPTSLSFSSVLGSAPAAQTFGITNNGLGSMTYTVATNYSWLSALPNGATLAAGAGQVHTAAVVVLAGQQAGTSNGTITITSSDATNSPKTIAVTWTISAIPDPSAQTATADGKELVRVKWTKDASYNVMVIHKSTNAPTVPTNGTTYSLGYVFADGSKVVAFNTATNQLDHVVAAGSTNYYAYYSMNGAYYSPGVSASATMGVYAAGEIVDQAGYTNGVSLSGLSGGTGWTNAWSTTGSGTWQIQTNFSDTGNEIPMMPTMAGYPSTAANRMKIDGLGSDQTAFAFRSFPAATTGDLYVASLVAFRYYGGGGANSRYMGISLFSGGTEKAFVGRAGGNNVLAIDATGSTKTESSYTMNGTEVGAGGSTGNVYLVVAKYDFANNKVYTKAYYRTDTVDASEPVWTITNTPSPAIASIDTIRIGGGAYSGNSMGGMWFDEVRVARSWSELLRLTQPVATNYLVNGGSNVSDGQIVGGTYSVVFDFYDSAGLTNSASLPQFDIWNSTGTRILTNQPFASLTYNGSGASLKASNATHAGASGSAVVLGVYTSRWTAANSNGVQVSNSDSLSNGTKTVFTVVDDDTAAPTIMTTHSPEISTLRNMHVTTNAVGHAPDGGSTTNIRYSLTDGYLAGQISGGAPLVFYFGARDAGSGLQRGNGSALTNSSLSIGSAIVSNTLQWDVTRSSAFTNTYDSTATNAWSWISPFSATEIDNLVTNTANGYGTNAVTLTWRDADFDRTDDQSSLSNQQHGFLIVIDDDQVAPVVSNNFRALGRLLQGGTFTNIEFVSGLAVTGSVADAFSGLYAGTSNRFDVKFQDGSTAATGAWTPSFANGANGSLSNSFSYASLSAVGIYTMAVTVVDYDIDRPNDALTTVSNFVFTVVAAPEVPGLAVGPLTLNYSVMLGSSPASQTFAVTNVGSSGTLIYTNYISYGTGASGWLSTEPGITNLAAGLTQLHTATVASATFNSIGTYYATNLVAGNQTNANQEVVVTLTVTNIPNPTAVTATPDGAEMIRLTATEAAGRTVLVVHSQTNAPSGTPSNGSAYNIGDALGNGTVAFKFVGSASVSNLEHVVRPGTTNFYALYTINNDRYSTGLVVGATTTVYQAFEVVDPFSYTNGVGLQTRGGGQGWTNSWTLSVPATNVDAVVTNSDFAAFQNYWPAEKGNRFIFKTTNSDFHGAFRSIPAVNSGKIYVAALYRRQFNEGPTDNKFSGLRFISGGGSGGSVMAFVGERGTAGNDDIFGVSTSPGGGSGSTYGANDSFPAGTDYLIIGRYDFDTDLMSGIYYTEAQSVPEVEPTFFVNATNSSITQIDAISLLADADSGWNGEVYFDEVRVATNWSELLLRDRQAPYATNYLVNGGADVYDSQVTGGTYGVRFHLRSQLGVESVNTVNPFFQPNYDIWSAAGVQILTDKVFSTFSYLDSGRTLVASNDTHASVQASSVVLGVYTARWSAVSSNGNNTINAATLSNGTLQTFTVVDDDTTAPSITTIQSTNDASFQNLHVSLGATDISDSGASTNTYRSLTDAQLASVSGGTPLMFLFGARDDSGLSRDTTGATNTSFSIGSVIVSNVANYDAVRSSDFASTTNIRSTNVWTFTSFSAGQIEGLLTNTASGYGTNAVRVTLFDADADRSGDQSVDYDHQYGYLVVTDDDTTAPTIQNFNIYGAQGSYTVRVDELTSGTGWSITGRVSDAGSGVNVNGTETNQPNNSPYFELWDPSGNLKLRQAFDTLSFADGGATTLSSLGDFTHGTLSSIATGTWTARVIVADNDEDFGNNDHRIGTNEIAFTVVSGTALGNIARGPASLVATSYFGTITGVSPWPNFAVTNTGAGTLNYSNSITYGSAAGWLSVAPDIGSLTGYGSSQIHTVAVNTASLNPGTYTATITINGDQTNAAQTVSVTLYVFGFYAGEIVDQFTNTVGASLHSLAGGTGWTSGWSNNPSTGFSIDSGNHTVPGNYPAASGNKVCGNATNELQAYRNFPAFSTGKVFVAATIQKSANNNNGFAGISFYDGATEVGFVGKAFNSAFFSIDNTNGTTASSFGIYQSQYFIVGMYDFDTDTMYGRAYNSGDTLSLTQPSIWSVTNANYTVNQITGIRLAGSAVSNLCFDEVRVSATWEGLLNIFTNEPTVHASGMNFDQVTTGSMVVGWSPGNGANRIVVAREGSAVTFTPTDSVAYAFSTDFSAAANLGNGNKVVYNGAGTNFTLTGLSSATQYFFAVFEYNGAGSTANYYTNGTWLTGNRWTLQTEPTAALASFNAYQSSVTSISNTWGLSSTILLDLGRHDSGTNGDLTVSPDRNGNYWNNIGPVTQGVSIGTKITNMVNAANGATTVGLELTTIGWQANGILNGGHTNPSSSLLGILAITNATKDYFFTSDTGVAFKVTGLNPASTYSLTFFGSRDATETRVTTYIVGTNSVSLTASGTGIGAGGVNYNNNTTAVLRALSPNGSGEIEVNLTRTTGSFAYLGILRIDEEPQPTGYLIFRQPYAAPTNHPSDGVAYTNGQYVSTSVVATLVTSRDATTVLHTGLQNCTPYYFTIYPYRQTAAQAESVNYLISAALTSTASTACGEPTMQASNVNFTTITTTNMQVTWANGNGSNRLVVARATNAVTLVPSDLVSYTANATFGSGSHLGGGNYVVYNGTGDFVNVVGLSVGVTYHYRVFEFYGDIGSGAENYNTNTAVLNPNSAATVSFELASDSFVRTNTATGQITDGGRASGGTGWNGNWSQSESIDIMHDANFAQFKCYPRDSNNGQVRMNVSDTTAHAATRPFSTRSSGKVYASWLMNMSSGGASTFAGLSFMSNTTEIAFAGKNYANSSNALGIAYNGTDYDGSYIINSGSGNDYLFVFLLDFEANALKVRVMQSDFIQSYDPDLDSSWNVVVTNVNIGSVDGIRIAKRYTGLTYFDEVRVGSTWEQVVLCSGVQNQGPVPTLVYIGTNYVPGVSGIATNLSDAELKESSGIDFAIRWDDPDGVFTTNSVGSGTSNIVANLGRVLPNWDPLAVGLTTNAFGLDRYFFATNIIGAGGSQVVTTYVRNAFNITNINFENQYFVTLSAEDTKGLGCSVSATLGENVYCGRGLTVNTAMQFYVYDDDTNAPVAGTRPLRVLTNASVADAQTVGNLERYFVYDGVLTSAGMRVSLNVYDDYSGLQRSAAGTAETNLNLTITSFVTNNAADWSSSLSSSSTTNPASTSVWSFAASAFTYASVSAMWGGNGLAVQGQDMDVLLNAPDADGDRVDDNMWSSNQTFGFIRVLDDDVDAPIATNVAYGGVSGSRLFAVTTNSTPATIIDRGGTGTNVYYGLTDEELVNANTRNVRFAFGAVDVSGLARGTSGSTNALMTFSLVATNGAAIVANNYSNYDAALSSASLSGSAITSVWSFASANIFDETRVNNLMTNGLISGRYVNTNDVWVTMVDGDNDRTNDGQRVDQMVGRLAVRDDDRLPPNVGGMAVMGSAGINIPSDLIISEYVEGSGNNKYVEIFNGTGGPVDLSAYAIGVYFNGATTFSGVNNPAYLTTVLPNGGTYVVANDSATIWGGTPDQIEGSVGNFNGNDAVVLLKKVGLVTNLVDVLGIIGDSASWLQDVTAVRRGHVDGPSTSWVSNDWDYLSINVLGGLGAHSSTEPVTDGDLASGGSVTLTGFVQDVTSGIYAQTGDPRAPRRSLKSNTGLALLSDGEFTHKPSSNGDAKTAEPLWENPLGAVNTNNVTIGIYTAYVSAVDYDIDRPSYGDSMTNNFEVEFIVVDDDTAGPTAATNIISSHTSWTNTTNVVVRWATNTVSDVSGLSGWRAGTNTPTNVTFGLSLGDGTVTQGVYTLSTNDEGVITNWLWAVDADGDRPLDQMYGVATSYVTRLDLTRPVALVNVTNDTTDVTVDETSELKVTWDPETDMPTAAGKRADGEPLSPWDTYVVTYHELDFSNNELTTNVVTYTNGPADLATNITGSMIISNLNFDSIFRIRIAGRDRAGNVGPETVITGETVRFVVTQGLTRVETTYSTSNQVEVYWLASSNKVYDVLYTDSPSLADNLTNTWKLMATVTNAMMWDNGGTGPDGDVRIGPALNQHTMRFYRVAREDVWRTNVSPRRASVEIYAAKPIRLVPGENWVSLFSVPDTATVAYVVGTNRLQGGTLPVDSPKISWFRSGNVGTNLSGEATNIIYLTSGAGWQYLVGGSGSANNQLMPLNQAFLLELPPSAPTQSLVMIGLVPTQDVVHVVSGGSLATNNYHLLSYNFPQRTLITQSGIRGSGFAGHASRGNFADEVRILKNRNGMGSMESPKARLWLTNNTTWAYYTVPTNTADFVNGVIPSASNFVIEPDDAVIIIRRNAGTMYWTNRPAYTPPGKNINP